MQMQVVDASNISQTNNPSIKEAFNPAAPSNSCGNGSPVPTPCLPTGPTCSSCGPGQFLDTLSVSGHFCGSGINRNSGCGYTQTSTWSACSTSGSNTLWTSPSVTHSNGVTVNSNTTTFAPGTQLP